MQRRQYIRSLDTSRRFIIFSLLKMNSSLKGKYFLVHFFVLDLLASSLTKQGYFVTQDEVYHFQSNVINPIVFYVLHFLPN